MTAITAGDDADQLRAAVGVLPWAAMLTPLPHEPDPLPAFRRFAYLWILLMALLALGLPFTSELTSVTRLSSLLYLGHALILAAYLSSSWLRRRLGAIYLPVALIYAAFGSQTILLLMLRLDLATMFAEPRSFANVVAIAHWLLLWPTVAVLIGWKYRLRHVAQFALAMGLFNLLAFEVLFASVRTLSLSGLLAFGFLSAALLTIGAFVRQLSRAEQEQRQALAAANARLVQAADTLEQLTVSRERNAMARELHDTLAHTLSSLAVQLETARVYWQADPEVARQLLEQALAATRNGLHETRRALQSLRATPLDDLGLVLAIERLAASAAERAGLALVLSLPTERAPLAADIEQGLYRIAQEAIANVVSHARANTLWVSLATEPGVTLCVRDDGAGFAATAEPPAGHYGLLGMYERAALIEASLHIASQPGAGACVTVVLGDGG